MEENYAISEFEEDNWVVRFLTNKMTQMLTRDDLDVAKEMLMRNSNHKGRFDSADIFKCHENVL